MTIRTVLADRRFHIAAGGVVALLLVALIALAMMPWGMFKSTIESRLSDTFGRPVTIGSVERLDSFSLSPTVAIRGLRIPQAPWAGPGDLIKVDSAKLRFPVLPLLFGHFRPGTIDVSGAHLVLVRDARRRKSWSKPDDPAQDGGGGDSISPTSLRIANSSITYRDAFQERAFTAKIVADPQHGVTLAGTGVVRGEPVTIAARGPAVEGAEGKPWPFRATIRGAALDMTIIGAMDAPLDPNGLSMDLTARADDLKFVDSIIEAGLFGTRPVKLKAHARRDGPLWKVTGISGYIGRSDIAGRIAVRKVEGRTKLDGAVFSNRLDFDDFASRAGTAAAAAKRQAIGRRLVPDTRINIRRITRTDGTIAFTVRQLISTAPSSLSAMRGTIKIDHQLMTVAPFTLDLTRGAIAGSMRVDQRGGRKEPLVRIDLTMRGSSIGALAGGGGEVDGRVDGRVKLTGTGSTIREVVGASDGTIGLVARDGVLPAKIASFLGLDLGRGLFTDKDTQSTLRCAIVRLAVRRGVGTADPFLIDTTRSQANGNGTISFPSEQIAIRLTGAPKEKSVLRLPGSLIIGGSIKAPDVALAPGTKSVGNIFKAIGRSIAGTQGPRATDADCAGLAARTLG
jgi:uncharacterized protein involved in outer membrane biogenesis